MAAINSLLITDVGTRYANDFIEDYDKFVNKPKSWGDFLLSWVSPS